MFCCKIYRGKKRFIVLQLQFKLPWMLDLLCLVRNNRYISGLHKFNHVFTIHCTVLHQYKLTRSGKHALGDCCHIFKTTKFEKNHFNYNIFPGRPLMLTYCCQFPKKDTERPTEKELTKTHTSIRVNLLGKRLISWKCTIALPPFSLIRGFRNQNTRGNAPKIFVNHTSYVCL